MIGVVADDLSGAAEIGAVGLRHGLRAEIVISDSTDSNADLVCVDTDSRSCNSDEAGNRAALAARRLMESGAQHIYKKVDSVLRGRVMAELEAMMKEMRLNSALLVPANPSLGRIIKEGRYFIRGKLIHRTEFARDPEYPRTSPKVLELLGRPKMFALSVQGRNDPLLSAGVTVGEAAASGDLRNWADRCQPDTLAAGAAEFFGAWLDRINPGGVSSAPVNAILEIRPARELFVCGTTSKSSRDFLKVARADRIPVFPLPSELVWGAEFTERACEAVSRRVIAAFEEHSRVILNVGLPLRRRPGAARRLTGHLVQLAEAVLRQAEVGSVYAEGGATAAALVRRMGWNRLTVMQELAPGVARLMVNGNKSLFLTIKPGSYVWPVDIQRRTLLSEPVKA